MKLQHAPTPFAATDENATGGGGPDSRGALAESKDKLAATARHAAAKVKSAAADTAARAKDQASRVATEKKETTASRLDDYGSAIHESARTLEEKDPNIAWLTHRAADRLRDTADYVRSRDFAGLRDDAERIARRHPGVFFGSMFLGGLLVGNLVKASRRKLDEADEESESPAPEAAGEWMSATEAAQAPQPVAVPSPAMSEELPS